MNYSRGLLLQTILYVFGIGNSRVALGRPEYAAKEKVNCVVCHVTPWGGGPRTIGGKNYGAHGHPVVQTDQSDLFYGSIRFIDFYPLKDTSRSVNGLGVMEAAATANVPFVHDESQSEMRGIFTYNLPTLGSANLREAYMRWQLFPERSSNPLSFLVGRFYVPFGLLTDEHRTYTRIQTNMTLNNYDLGLGLSLNIMDNLQLDFAIVNNFQTGGKFNREDIPIGTALNFRWNPKEIPFLFGISGNYERLLNTPQPYAGSLYAVLSCDQLTNSKISGSILLEGLMAKNWNNPVVNTGLVNPSLFQFFIPTGDSDYLTSVLGATSLGFYSQAKYNLTHVWTLVYHFDFLALDMDSLASNYTRHGFGFEAYLTNNVIWNMRYEIASSPAANFSNESVLATQSDLYTMFRVWL